MAATSAGAQTYPVRPVRIVVPFPPGGSNDIVARLLAQKLNELWGQPVIVDNRGGAGGTIGVEVGAKGQPDGHTLLIGATSTMAVNVALYPKLQVHPLKDLAPIAKVAGGAFVLVAHGGLPVTSAKDLIALARAKPGSLNFGSSGSGTSLHLAAELFKLRAGIDIVHVPYKGAGPAIVDLVSGQIAIVFTDMAPVAGHVKAGRLKALAASTARRTAPLPDLPTLQEAGVAGYEAESWYGILAPAATSPALLDRIQADLAKVVTAADTQQRLIAMGIEGGVGTPQAFRQLIGAEIAKWSEVVKLSGARVD